MNFKSYPLGNLVNIRYGKNQKKVASEKGTFPIYGTGGLMGYATEPLYDKPSVLIGRKGTIDKVRYVTHPFWTVDTLFYTEIDDTKVLPHYLYYYLSLLDLKKYNEGTTIPSLRTETLNRIEISVPEIEEQQCVLALLEPIDSKIETNKQINDNLEQQLHQLFIQTFNGCDTNITLGKVVKTTSGGTPARKHREYYSNGTINWVKSKELTGQYLFDTEESLTSLGVAMSSAKILPAHSVLIAMYGATVGEHGITTKEMACNQAICALLENKDYPYTYLFQIAKENQQNLVNLAIGSAQQNISQILLKQLPVHSDVATIHQYHCLALPLHKEIELLQSENRLLNTTRDALLPELMTGELDLSSVDF